VRFRKLSLLVVAIALPLTVISTVVGSGVASAATKTKTTKFTLSCKTGIANGDVAVTTTQTYPSSVAPGASFTIQWKSVTEVEGALASAAFAIAPNGSEQGTVTLDTDLVTNGTPSSQNVAGTNGLPEEGSISSPNGFPIYTPPQGSTPGFFTTQSFTAGKKGTMTISAQDDNATVTIYNSSGTAVTTTSADCTPVGKPKVIAKIKVT
jgi:hypothetical protein